MEKEGRRKEELQVQKRGWEEERFKEVRRERGGKDWQARGGRDEGEGARGGTTPPSECVRRGAQE